MRNFILVLYVLCSFRGESQEIDYAPHSISFNFISIFSPYHFNFNISYERRFSEKIALEVGLAPIFSGDYSTGPTGKRSCNGWIVRVEPKYFISNVQEVDTTESIFISTQFYASIHKYKLIDYDRPDYKTLRSSNIKNYALGVVGHFGYHRTGGLTYSELSAGYGRKWVFTINDNYRPSEDIYELDQLFWHTRPGWNSLPAIGLNAKIGANFE